MTNATANGTKKSAKKSPVHISAGGAVSFRLAPDKECKGSIRYAVIDDAAGECPVQTVYLSRDFARLTGAAQMPGEITLTVAASG